MTRLPARRCRIEQWSVHASAYQAPEVRRTCLQGVVYGHPDYADGDRIYTGALRGAEGNLAWSDRTAYALGEPDAGYLAWLAEKGLAFDPANPIKVVGRLTDVPAGRTVEEA